jgi:hypothetical protein
MSVGIMPFNSKVMGVIPTSGSGRETYTNDHNTLVPVTRGDQIQSSGMSKWHFSGTILSFNIRWGDTCYVGTPTGVSLRHRDHFIGNFPCSCVLVNGSPLIISEVNNMSLEKINVPYLTICVSLTLFVRSRDLCGFVRTDQHARSTCSGPDISWVLYNSSESSRSSHPSQGLHQYGWTRGTRH